MLDQDVLHAGFADMVAQMDNLVPDILVAPTGILFLDSHILQEVIFNLCTNAPASMPDGGEFCLRSLVLEADTFGQLKRVAIEVADTGCGIPESNISKVFEPFFTTRKDAGGTGLGLALCRMLVSEMDGQIEVSSVSKQETIFRLILNAAGRDLCDNEVQK